MLSIRNIHKSRFHLCESQNHSEHKRVHRLNKKKRLFLSPANDVSIEVNISNETQISTGIISRRFVSRPLIEALKDGRRISIKRVRLS